MTQGINPSRNCEAEWADSQTLDCEKCAFGPVMRSSVDSIGQLLVTHCDNAYERATPSDVRKQSFATSLERNPNKLYTFYFLTQTPDAFMLDDFNAFVEAYGLTQSGSSLFSSLKQQGMLRMVKPHKLEGNNVVYQRSQEVDWGYVAGVEPIVKLRDSLTVPLGDDNQIAMEVTDWLQSLE